MDVWGTDVKCPNCGQNHKVYVVREEIPAGNLVGKYECTTKGATCMSVGTYAWSHGTTIPDNAIKIVLTEG